MFQKRKKRRKRHLKSLAGVMLERLEDRLLLISPWQNPCNPLDTTDDGFVTPFDVLIPINRLNSTGAGTLPNLPGDQTPPPYHDVNGNGSHEPLDVLRVINALNGLVVGEVFGFDGDLTNDTARDGLISDDMISSDPRLEGLVTSILGVESYEAQIDGGDPVGVTPRKCGDWVFPTNLALDGSADGAHTVSFVARDHLNREGDFQTTFTLDTIPPALSVQLDPASDTGTTGDGVTSKDVVRLVGLTEPDTPLTLDPGGLRATSDASGAFAFDNVPLTADQNLFTLMGSDVAGNIGSLDASFARNPTGTLLHEGSAFVTSLQTPIRVPAEPSYISVSYADLSFDSIADFINDSFEISLVDEEGQPLVHVIDGGRNALLNITEGETPVLAANTQHESETVRVDLTHVPAGTEATLIVRLVNNDSDTETSVLVEDISIVSGELGTPISIQPFAAHQSIRSLLDFDTLSDITSSIVPRYGHTSFNEIGKDVFVEVSLSNLGRFAANKPLVVAIDNLSDPTVRVSGVDGFTPDGLPYYDFSDLATSSSLDPGETTDRGTIAFNNPADIQFDFDLLVLGQLNRAPTIVSEPSREALVGLPYQYDVEANDADGDPLTFQLLSAPSGMTIEAFSGFLHWTPTLDDLGSHFILVQVEDGRGGADRHSFVLATHDGVPNRPPIFGSTPLVDATVGTPYRYAPIVVDPDGDEVSFAIASGPEGMTIHPREGDVEWTPSGGQLGQHNVTIDVQDGRGAATTQSYVIAVGNALGNHAPVIYTDPVTILNLPGNANPPSGDVSPSHLRLGTNQTIEGTVSLTLPSESGLTFADVVIVVDESPSMVGEHAWLFEMVQQLETALVERGIGPNRYAVVGFGNSDVIGHFHVSESVTFSLYGPDDNLVGDADFGPTIGPTFFAAELAQDGVHTLVVDVENPGPAIDYSFDAVVAQLLSSSLTLGTTVSDSISVTGETREYGFTLDKPSLLYFDSLTDSDQFLWILQGPEGNVIEDRRFDLSDSVSVTEPILKVPAGQYTLSVKAPPGVTGEYTFVLHDLDLVPALTVGAPVSRDLVPANKTDLFQFDAASADRFYFDTHEQTDLRDSQWLLVDPYGVVVFSNALTQDVETIQLANAGTYTLLIEGRIGQNSPAAYAINVQSVDFSSTPLTLGSVVSQSIGVPGEQDEYTFSLSESRLVYLDSRADSAQVHWTLRGPTGTLVSTRRFSGSEASTNAVLNLGRGAYRLIVDADTDLTGEYSFRMMDLASAMPMAVGTTVSGELSPGDETDLYQFSGNAGDQFVFSGADLPASRMSDAIIVGPFGRVVLSTPLGGNPQPFDLTSNGPHTLLVQGSLLDRDPSSYEVTLGFLGSDPPPPLAGTPLTLGAVVSESISAAGEQDNYRFTLVDPGHLYFDSLANSSSVNWTLIGPRGDVVNSRRFSASDSSLANPVLNVDAGEYQLTVAGVGSSTGDYAFRLWELRKAASITPGTPVNGPLDPPNSSDVYQFPVTAGDRFYFDALERSGSFVANYLLIDPHGQVVIKADKNLDTDTIRLDHDGVHTLIVQGRITNTSPVDYSLNVQPVTFSTVEVVPGSLVTESIGVPGERDEFTFSLPADKLLYFDSLTNSSQLSWTLAGPLGTIVDRWKFDLANVPILDLVHGTYTLTVDALGDVTDTYAFRLSDLSNATRLTTGVATSGDLTPGNETDLYRFDATAGERFYIDRITSTTSSPGKFRVLDPFGQVHITSGLNQDPASFVATNTGSYTLLVEGDSSAPAGHSYDINVHRLDELGPVPLPLGDLVSSTIDVPGDEDTYSFTLDAFTLLYFDSMTNDLGAKWTLRGPRGTVVDSRPFSRSDARGIGDPVLRLFPGDYELTVDRERDDLGEYQFRLSDLSGAVPLTLGSPVSGELTGGNETDLFQFTASAGDQVFYDSLQRIGIPSASWRLIDPFGQSLFSTLLNTDVDTLELPSSGTYTLAIEGRVSDSTTGTYAINAQPVTVVRTALGLGSQIDGTIGTSGELDEYSLALSTPALLYFDSLTSSSQFTWTLAGPSGTVVDARRFDRSDASRLAVAAGGSPVVAVPAGEYTLTVDGVGAASGSYSYRLSDLVFATPLTPGNPVSADLNPGNETHLYRFEASTDQRFYFDSQQLSGVSGARWRLIDPFGKVVINQALHRDQETIRLPNTGTYTLLVEGRVSDTAAGTYTINVQPVTTATVPLTIGATASGSIGVAGETDDFTFALAQPAQLYFDSLTDHADIQWTLVGPSGTVVERRSVSASDIGISEPVLRLPSGGYTLTMDGKTDATGDYQFRFVNLAEAAPLTLEATIQGDLTPSSETDSYRFDAAAGDQLFFASQQRTGIPGSQWRLVDPFGQILFSRPLNLDETSVEITNSGTHTLLVEGSLSDNAPGSYAFSVEFLGNNPGTPLIGIPITLGSVVNGAISAVGEQDEYLFTMTEEGLVYFDSFTDVSRFNWTLTGPTGPVASGQQFNRTSPVMTLVPGDYQLTVAEFVGTTGNYSFRLSDLAMAPSVVPGLPFTGELMPGNETDIYQFTASAGDRFYFESQQTTAVANAKWRLFDRFGRELFEKNLTQDVETLQLANAGRYTLLIEGGTSASAPGSYTLNVQPVNFGSAPLELGDLLSASLSVVGEQDQYTFTLAEPSRLYFDSRTNDANLTWTLMGPSGTVVEDRQFSRSDADSLRCCNDSPVFSVPAGSYTLQVDGKNEATGAYAFRLSNLATATPMVVGTVITWTLMPGNETDFYQFRADAGNRFYFDSQEVSGIPGARWRLVDPFGQILFHEALTTDHEALSLAASGTYTLLVEGRVGDAEAGSYTVNVQPVFFQETLLSFGSTINGTIAGPGQRDTYQLGAVAGQTLYYDGRGNSEGIHVEVFTPGGRSLFDGDSDEDLGPVTVSETGTYRFVVDGDGDATGAFSFQVVDLGAAATLALPQSVHGSLDPATAVNVFQIDGEVGQTVSLFSDDIHLAFGSAAAAAQATLGLWHSAGGSAVGFEDGYSGIDVALREGIFRPGAALNLILVTDEDRDVFDDTLSFASMASDLTDQQALLNTVVLASFEDGTGQSALGVDAEGNAYLPNGAGGFVRSDGGEYTGAGFQNAIKTDYVDLAWALDGAAWDLRKLRDGGLAAESFTSAIVDIKVAEIVNQLQIDVIASDSNVVLENLTGPLTTSELVPFEVRISSGEIPRSFDLLFVRPGTGFVLGSIPVLMGDEDYEYTAQATDADGDLLTYSLIEAPEGATIDAASGQIHWEPSQLGDYAFAVLADDGRGGQATQEYTVTVTANEPSHDLTVTEVEQTGLVVDGQSLAVTGEIEATIASLGGEFVTDDFEVIFFEDRNDNGTLQAGVDNVLGQTAVTSSAVLGEGITVSAELSGFALFADNFIHAYVDSRNVIQETDETNNYAHRACEVTPTSDGNSSLLTVPDLTASAVRAVTAGPNVTLTTRIGNAGSNLVAVGVSIAFYDGDPSAGGVHLGNATTTTALRPGQFEIVSIVVPRSSLSDVWVSADDDGTGEGQVIECSESNNVYHPGLILSPSNVPPLIVSDPLVTAVERVTYSYDVDALDADLGDTILYSLTAAPAGTSIHAGTGLIRWTPAADAAGQHTIQVVAEDSKGGQDFQLFTVEVAEAVNSAPRIVSNPVVGTRAGFRYRYPVIAVDQETDPLTFELVVHPTAMAIDPSTGVIVWETTPGEVGIHDVIARVSDARGEMGLQAYQVLVAPHNSAPSITSVPPATAVVDLPYRYPVRVQDADGDLIDLDLVTAPAGMAIDQFSSTVDWRPTAEQVGSHTVTIVAHDGLGGHAEQTFDLEVVAVLPNDPPTITSLPRESIRLGGRYLYDVEASDPNADPLTFTLDAAPAGMTINQAGMIDWEPTASQFGQNSVQVVVDDGRGGVANQSFVVEVVTQSANQSPTIASTPLLAATVDRPYRYDMTATDREGDPLFWHLNTAPAGMSIDPRRGLVRWVPTASQLGAHEVIVQVLDAQGGFDVQSFTVTARAVNVPPTITSTPPTSASLGETYRYPVTAIDVENDPLIFSLRSSVPGMTIDRQSGLIEWQPASFQLGTVAVALDVDDQQGGVATQSFLLSVSELPENQAPVITSLPSFVATVDQPYAYQVAAADPNGDLVSFSLLAPPSGISIDSVSGLLEWTPDASQIGHYAIQVVAADPVGATATQSYTLSVLGPNHPPVITSEPQLTTTAGQEYRYDVRANDPDDDPLDLSLDAAPSGMTVDKYGRIVWLPASADLGLHRVTITVVDNRGSSTSQSFDLRVEADDEPPIVNLQFSDNPIDVGSLVTFSVVAVDNVGVEVIDLVVDGTPVALDADNRATVQMETAGEFEVSAAAMDASGNSAEAVGTLFVIDTSDVDAPRVELLTPIDEAMITSLTDVIGTASDDNLSSYSLSIARVGSNEFTEIARGTDSVVADVLGTFDPSVLSNDVYTLRLAAIDAGGNRSVDQVRLSVAGDLKLGNFALSFTDLSIPVSGIPITVSRTYDTRTADSRDDFGFGWRLEIGDTDLRVSVPETGLEDSFVFSPYRIGTRVYVTLPGGRREGFTFEPQRADGFRGSFVGIFEPRFTPDEGVTSELSVSPTDLRVNSLGEFYDFLGTQPYNAASPALGGTFTLTTNEGIAYQINGRTGDVELLGDTNGNTLTFTDGGVFSSTGKAVLFERDAEGRITAVIDPVGNRVAYEYDAAGDLTGVTDREGNVTQFVYDAPRPHYLTEVIDPLGRSGARSEFDELGRLVKLIDAQGHAVEMIHDPNNSIETVIDQLGNPTSYEYDHRGNIVRETNALGAAIIRTYDPRGNTLTETDPLGNTTTFTYDQRGNLLSETDALGNVTRTTYLNFVYGATALAAIRGQASLPFSRVLTTTDPLGNTTTNAYSSDGNLVAITDTGGATTQFAPGPGGQVRMITDPLGQGTSFEYDLAGELVQQTDPLGNETTFTYDENGNQLTETFNVTTPTGLRSLTSARSYDSDGRLTSSTDVEGNTTVTEYDAVGNRIATIDALGYRTEFRYDDRGSLLETIFPDDTPDDLTDNPRTRTEYDAAGQQIAAIDELGRRTEFVFDAAGQLAETILADDSPSDLIDNPRTHIEYDLAGRVVRQSDELGNATEFEYDATSNQTVTRDALGNETVSVYDSAGRRARQTDALGHTTQFGYDDAGRLAETTLADGTSVVSAFDEIGRVASRWDQAGNVTGFEYDRVGRLTAVVDALNQRTTYDYDERGNLVQQVDANGHSTSFEYDGLGRRTATVLALGQESSVTYDAVGNVLSSTDFNGDTITLAYDARNRLSGREFPGGASVHFTYTATGLPESVSDRRGTTTYRYDARDRLLSRTDPDGSFIGYAYDEAGNRTSISTLVLSLGSRETFYTFDALNRMQTVTDPEGGVTTYMYDEVGNLVRMEFPNQTVETREYDDLNRLLFLEHKHSVNGQILSSYEYTLDPVGNRKSVSEHDGRRVVYDYDEVYRLLGEQIFEADGTNRSIDYVYDSVGNRLTRDDSAEGVTEYRYDASDRLLSETLTTLASDVAETTYSYDDNGNTKSKVSPSQAVFYSWDFENRLIGADTDGDGTTDIEYQYDANGVRVAQTSGGEETRVLIDKNRPYAQVLVEYTPGGILLASYVHGRDLISQNRAGVQSFYHVDGLGSTRALSDANGLVTDRYIYDAFGRTIGSVGTTGNVYLFAGEARDFNVGLDYLRARYMDVGNGRFASRDTFEGLTTHPLSLHRYIYAGGNPVNNVDPSGLTFIGLVTGALTRLHVSSFTLGGALGAAFGATAVQGSIFAVAHRHITELKPELGRLANNIQGLNPSASQNVRGVIPKLDATLQQLAMFLAITPLTAQIPIGHVTISVLRLNEFLSSVAEAYESAINGLTFSNQLGTFHLSFTWSVNRFKLIADMLTFRLYPAQDIRIANELIEAFKRRDVRQVLIKRAALIRRLQPYGTVDVRSFQLGDFPASPSSGIPT